jgi:hypothetical protein
MMENEGLTFGMIEDALDAAKKAGANRDTGVWVGETGRDQFELSVKKTMGFVTGLRIRILPQPQEANDGR